MQAGYAFDFVSDAQLQRLTVNDGAIVAPGGRYRSIVVPATRRMSVETLARLRELAKQGARVEFESLPQDVPGFGHLEARRAKLRALLEDPALRAAVAGENLACRARCAQEQAPQVGLAHIRRARADGYDYFFANLTGTAFDGWLQLGTPGEFAMILDPLTGHTGTAAVKRANKGNLRVYLQLASGESTLVRTWRAKGAHKRATLALREARCCGHRIAGRVAVSSSSREGRRCRVPHA